MKGDVLVDLSDGWCCSNAAEIMTETDVVRDASGKPTGTLKTTVLRTMDYFIVCGHLQVNVEVELVFRPDGTETRIGYKATVSGLTPEMVVFKIGEEIKEVENILKKIGGYKNAK